MPTSRLALDSQPDRFESSSRMIVTPPEESGRVWLTKRTGNGTLTWPAQRTHSFRVKQTRGNDAKILKWFTEYKSVRWDLWSRWRLVEWDLDDSRVVWGLKIVEMEEDLGHYPSSTIVTVIGRRDRGHAYERGEPPPVDDFGTTDHHSTFEK